MMFFSRLKLALLFASYLLLVACGGLVERSDGPPSRVPDLSVVPDAVPKYEPIRPQNQKSYVVLGKRYYPLPTATGYREKGLASWYGKKFHGNPTATGERYDMYQMTAAHKTLPLPSYVEVRNLTNGRTVVVRVNDRGPFHQGRIIDLSYAAATKLGIIGNGTGLVEVRAVSSQADLAQSSTRAYAEPSVPRPVGLFLQIGTFSTAVRAEQLKNKLEKVITDDILIMPLNRPDGRLYRVRIGPLTNVEYGDALATRLMKLGYNDSHVVVE